jgi:MoaA/NifB/PqqE/SkfB family radical SAM enzyme/protein-L-isoaspartate O-methyltransferase
MHPKTAAFFKEYLSNEKVIRFRGLSVLNTNFPPYPGKAFDTMAEQFSLMGEKTEKRLYSVTWAVTNRCTYHCWHCYNAGRSQRDVPLGDLRRLVRQLQDMDAVIVTLTGGEPLLRDDLEEIVGLFDDRTCLLLGTTGAGLTADRARRLREGGLFAVGISLDSMAAAEHDRLRGKKGAFRTTLRAIHTAQKAGIYPYVVSVATRDFLRPERFWPFLRFAGEVGALEVHLLEPSASGRLAGRTDVVLSEAERRQILDYQRRCAGDDALPILSTFTYVESAEAFGCGAGRAHIYIDGAGEVCPCNLVPLSFGNITREPLAQIVARMRCVFCRPRTGCVGRLLAPHIPEGRLPLAPKASAALCKKHLPRRHPLPRFFQIRREAQETVGRDELQAAYDRVHGDYDDFWLTEAAKPIDELVRKLCWSGSERVFEAGCGTGYATALLADRAKSVLAADLSKGMLAEACRRLGAKRLRRVRLICGDALKALKARGPFDIVFTSWVLGYIPLEPFFAAANRALVKGGQLAFVVHKENSPREPLEIFAELLARDPSVLLKRVAFDFPRDRDHVRAEMAAAGFEIGDLWEGEIVFRYGAPQGVLDHLLKSGAGTAFYDAIAPDRRRPLTDEFLRLLAKRRPGPAQYEVNHEYVACIALKP